MKDLVAATRVPKSTILHYLNEGLLPQPLKTSRNMAYYDPACVERVLFIKMMQSKHRLPLAVIKRLFSTVGPAEVIEPLLELSAAIFGRQENDSLYDLQAFCQATDLSSEEVKGLLTHGVLQPLEPDRFDQDDVAIGRLLHHCLEQLLNPASLAFYPLLAREIVDQEMTLRDRLVKGLTLEDNAALTLQLTRVARALRPYIIDRIFQHRVMTRKSLEAEEEK